MRMKAKHIAIVLVLATSLPAASTSKAQHFRFGADVVSRYVWRGSDIGESPSIQPSLSVSARGFEIGTWASYAIDPESSTSNEHDLWLGFTTGPISFGVTDYYFPNLGAGFFDFDDDGAGAHYIEPYAAFSGPAAFPIALFAGVFAYNDPDRSVYLNATYPFTVENVAISVGLGASAAKSAMYGTSGFGIVELTLRASRELQLTDRLSIPLSVGYVLNPYAEKSFLILGITL